ncbi:MAG: di-heme-cytochrome C peroxidase [Allosphingosinicella sp.]
MCLAFSASLLALGACGHVNAGPDTAPKTQGWTDAERHAWYRGTQGSRLMPYDWLIALEDPNSTALFMAPAHFDRFGYLREPGAGADALPIGFAIDVQSDKKLLNTKLRWFAGQGAKEPWVGLNCSACHTNLITSGTNTAWVDGAATLADFQGFQNALHAAMDATRRDPAKWDRFAARALTRRDPKRDTPQNRAQLKAAFETLFAAIDRSHRFNQTDSVYGHGRLDAVGHILNQVAINAVGPGGRQISGEPDAPVSYPFIWNAGQQDVVQWNGIAPNKAIRFPSGQSFNIGGLVRNTSEVIGVFGDVRVRPDPGLDGYKSSIRVGNLDNIETQLARLESPRWPAAFGTPKPTLVAKGKALFEDKCQSCHKPLAPNDVTSPITAHMTPVWGPGGVGTDPWMVCNAYTYEAQTGMLEGMALLPGSDPMPARTQTRKMLVTESVGVLLGRKSEVVWTAARKLLGFQRKIEVDELEAGFELEPQLPQAERLAKCIADGTARPLTGDAKLLQYKARPLNGIWATAPYLHNGSVKSLFELLLPPEKRDPEFWVGNRELDVKHVGFVDAPGSFGSMFRTQIDGKPVHGNSNAGHDYGNAALDDDMRIALVEYMKTL